MVLIRESAAYRSLRGTTGPQYGANGPNKGIGHPPVLIRESATHYYLTCTSTR
jgi:hypothetical protein